MAVLVDFATMKGMGRIYDHVTPEMRRLFHRHSLFAQRGRSPMKIIDDLPHRVGTWCRAPTQMPDRRHERKSMNRLHIPARKARVRW
ncbi:hypothetical protein [Kutzneria sp. NPDC051319]|uniref:hypothetical protein n=1 Tax=Kutzneria sp. NPDC051319 TaxID=3155047 RepID=UPI0034325ED2